MSRLPAIVLGLAALAFAGCQPKDPLDQKISASSPGAYNDWLDRHHPTLPLEVQQEFDRAFGALRGDTAVKIGSTDLAKIQNWLCTRLNGKTIRSVIVEGYQVESDALRTRIVVASDNIVRTLKAGESRELPAAQRQGYAAAGAAQEQAIAIMRSRIAEIDARVGRLSLGAR